MPLKPCQNIGFLRAVIDGPATKILGPSYSVQELGWAIRMSYRQLTQALLYQKRHSIMCRNLVLSRQEGEFCCCLQCIDFCHCCFAALCLVAYARRS